jgi:hypothetical protein
MTKDPTAKFQRILLAEDASLSLLLHIGHKLVEEHSARGLDRTKYAPAGAGLEMQSPAAGLCCRLMQRDVLVSSVGQI